MSDDNAKMYWRSYDYEPLRKQFAECEARGGIPLPWCNDPMAPDDWDDIYELAYERYMEETDGGRRSHPDAAVGPHGRAAEQGDIDADFELG